MSDPERLRDLRIERREPEAGRARPWRVLAFSALVLGALAAVAGWWLSRPRAVAVRVRTVAEERPSAASATVLDATGYVVARRRATVSSKITGKVVEVLLEEGMAVAEGDVLARLDDANARRALALTEAEVRAARRALAEIEVRLADARRDVARSRALVEAAALSQSRLDDDQAEVDALDARLALGREQVTVAERRVAVARQALEDTVIRAPFDGVVVTKDAQPGEMISPVSAGGGFTRTGVGTLVDMGSLEIEVDVNEAYIGRVRPGQRVQAVLDAYPDWQIPGAVITTVPTADRQRATVKVRIAFDPEARSDPRLLPDMGVKVAFLEDGAEVASAGRSAGPPRLWLDESAVRDGDGEPHVFVVEGGLARRRTVVLGASRGGRVVVESGLAAGERVVVDPPPELVDGALVEIE